MDNTSDILKLLPEYLKVFAIIVAGIWAYRKFIYQREKEPAADIDIDVRFVGIQDHKWIIEVTSFVGNKSLVRLSYKNFQVTIRYLMLGDTIKDGSESINYQLNCSKTIDERIEGQKRLFANVDYINPKQEFKHRYVTFVPIETSFIWVQCKFIFGKNETRMNSQKIFHVPVNDEKQLTK